MIGKFKGYSCSLAAAALILAGASFSPSPARADGRYADIVIFEGESYDGACLYRLAGQYRGIPYDEFPEAEYRERMMDCAWNGVENPEPKMAPKETTYNCFSLPCYNVRL